MVVGPYAARCCNGERPAVGLGGNEEKNLHGETHGSVNGPKASAAGRSTNSS